MYGRNTNNIFSKNSSTSNSSTNIFSRNSTTNNNSSYGNNNSSYGNNNSSYGNNNPVGDLGSYRVKDYKASVTPRVLEDINSKWKSNQLNPQSISIRPETLHLSVVELRNEDYFLVRQQKMSRQIEKAMEEVVKKNCFNPDLVNSNIVGNMREPETFRQGPVSIDILKAQKNRTLYGSGNNSNNSYSSPSNNSNNVFGNRNNNSNNIFSSSNNNSSSGNIFASNSRNTYGNNNNSSNNNNPFNRNTNNSSSNNIFANNNNNSYNNNNNGSSGSNNIFGGNNNNMNNSRNPFNSNNNMNNSGSGNIFANNNNNNNNNNQRNIFASNNNNNNNSSGNIFNSTNRNNNNIFGNNNNGNNNNSNNIFNNNNNNNNYNNNNNRGNNIFASNNNNNNNRNLFNNNQNNNNNNNIFSNQNQNQNNQNQNQYGFPTNVNEFFMLKIMEENHRIHKQLAEQKMIKRGHNLTNLYYGAGNNQLGSSLYNTNSLLMNGNNGYNGYMNQSAGYLNGNSMYMNSSGLGFNNAPNHLFNNNLNNLSYQSTQLQNYDELLISQPTSTHSKVKQLLDSSHPYPMKTSVIVHKEFHPIDEDQDEYDLPRNYTDRFDLASKLKNLQKNGTNQQQNGIINRESMMIAGKSQANNGNNIFPNTQSIYIKEEMQMRQMPRAQQNMNQPPHISNEQNKNMNNNISMERSQNMQQSNNLFQNIAPKPNGAPLARITSQGESGSLNLPNGYIYKFKRVNENIVRNLQITNEFGTARWPCQTNISNINFTANNFSIQENTISCKIPQLNKECFVTYFSIPHELEGLEEREAELNLEDYLKESSDGNIQLQTFSFNASQYTIRVKSFDYGLKKDAEAQKNLSKEQPENQEP